MQPDAEIIAAFQQRTDRYLSLDEVGQVTGLTRDVVVERVEVLARLGYVFEHHPHHGYRLADAPDRLMADAIEAEHRGEVIGSRILVFDSTGSTSDVIARHAARARDGLVVFAETQTQGRGRQGRSWVSPRGKGLWFSVLLRPPDEAAQAARLTVLASVAVARAVRAIAQVDACIKWPNDIVCGGRKLAGILTEFRGAVAIVGVGINVNLVAEDFPDDLRVRATSLQIESGAVQDRNQLAGTVLTEMDRLYRSLATGFESVIDEWAALSVTLGQQVEIRQGDRCWRGLAQALDAGGRLILRRDNGQIEYLADGEVVVAR